MSPSARARADSARPAARSSVIRDTSPGRLRLLNGNVLRAEAVRHLEHPFLWWRFCWRGFPQPAVDCVAGLVKVPAVEFAKYDLTSRSATNHRKQIREALKFRPATRADGEKPMAWLAAEVCPVELVEDRLREALLVQCRARTIEPPGRIDRIVRAAQTRAEKTFCARTSERLGCSVAGLPAATWRGNLRRSGDGAGRPAAARLAEGGCWRLTRPRGDVGTWGRPQGGRVIPRALAAPAPGRGVDQVVRLGVFTPHSAFAPREE
ncbi:DUF4158 domain-containing protein [Streptomyces sp. NPDC001351]|uniref:DUF4158 domain-containing protein n=1 Tax=Streptomyces sp. NPDC001351 TaxID=3364564 RepID=UPI0036C6BF58